MLALIAIFGEPAQSCRYGEKALLAVSAVFPDWQRRLRTAQGAVVYHAGREGADKPAVAIALKEIAVKDTQAVLHFGKSKTLEIKSGDVGGEVYRAARFHNQLDSNGHAPLLYFFERAQFEMMSCRAKLGQQAEELINAGDYKGVCMLFAPLKSVRSNAAVWDSAELLYKLGLACSKLAVTLKVGAAEKKRLEEARRYRSYCSAFLQRGAALEPDNARCATALAYRYYSNVHELMRPGERRDQDITQQIDKAHEWLSRALEIYPDSIRNHYRKGKLIIEKQAPYLLFGRRAFGSREAELLREIREVGEEHLARAVSLYEALEDEEELRRNRREYAKALFVLGGYYLEDAYLPIHEYYLSLIAGKSPPKHIAAIAQLDLKSAREHLEKCFGAESKMALEELEPKSLCGLQKEWTRSPVEKLYRLGCVHSALAFAAKVEGKNDELKTHAGKAVYYLDAAAKTAVQSVENRRSTWHICEKLAWTHLHAGRCDKAQAVLSRAKQGHIANTRAVALLLADTPQSHEKAAEVLQTAAKDRHNLASGFTHVLLAYINKQNKKECAPLPKALSAKNKRAAALLGINVE